MDKPDDDLIALMGLSMMMLPFVTIRLLAIRQHRSMRKLKSYPALIGQTAVVWIVVLGFSAGLSMWVAVATNLAVSVALGCQWMKRAASRAELALPDTVEGPWGPAAAAAPARPVRQGWWHRFQEYNRRARAESDRKIAERAAAKAASKAAAAAAIADARAELDRRDAVQAAVLAAERAARASQDAALLAEAQALLKAAETVVARIPREIATPDAGMTAKPLSAKPKGKPRKKAPRIEHRAELSDLTPSRFGDPIWEGSPGETLLFEYADSHGVISEREVVGWTEYENHIIGICTKRRASRTFRKDSILSWIGGRDFLIAPRDAEAA